ncbi:MAG: lactate utilization protein B/C [Bacteroidetes bacterium]|nr:lactate utilization protein B/C [Bacteroidota bacterium]
MNILPAKENILKRIRKALAHETPMPFPNSEKGGIVFPGPTQELEVEFAEQFVQLQGKFIYCINRQELAFQFGSLVRKQDWAPIFCADQKLIQLVGEPLEERLTQTDLAGCNVAVTGCEFLVARTGSILLSSAQVQGRTASVYAPIHICIAFVDQLVYDIKDAFQGIREKYGPNYPSLVSLATGPSRTADIEKTLVVGVHGPKEVYLFLVEA